MWKFLGLILFTGGVLSREQPNLMKRGVTPLPPLSSSSPPSIVQTSHGAGAPVVFGHFNPQQHQQNHGQSLGGVIRGSQPGKLHQSPQLISYGRVDPGHHPNQQFLQLLQPLKRYQGGPPQHLVIAEPAIEMPVPDSVLKQKGVAQHHQIQTPPYAAVPYPYHSSPHLHLPEFAPEERPRYLQQGPSHGPPHGPVELQRLVGFRGIHPYQEVQASHPSNSNGPSSPPFELLRVGPSLSFEGPSQPPYRFNQPVHTLGDHKDRQNVGVTKGIPLGAKASTTKTRQSHEPQREHQGFGHNEYQEDDGPVMGKGHASPPPNPNPPHSHIHSPIRYILQNPSQGPPSEEDYSLPFLIDEDSKALHPAAYSPSSRGPPLPPPQSPPPHYHLLDYSPEPGHSHPELYHSRPSSIPGLRRGPPTFLSEVPSSSSSSSDAQAQPSHRKQRQPSSSFSNFTPSPYDSYMKSNTEGEFDGEFDRYPQQPHSSSPYSQDEDGDGDGFSY